jgi:hypothetical protein
VDEIDFNEHYAAFQWALSKGWKHKNDLYESIRYRVDVLTDEYALLEQDVVAELFSNYWERAHYKKYDASKGSLRNWIAHYVNSYLKHLIRRHAIRAKHEEAHKADPLDQKNRSSIEWIDKDNIRDDPDYQPELDIDWTNPESSLIAKETLEFIKGHFSEVEIEHLMGEIGLDEAARLSGTSCEAFRRRLDRRIADFKMALKVIEKN